MLYARFETYTNGLNFTVSADSCSVVEYTGTDSSVLIPHTYNGVNVTSIGAWAFANCQSLTNITIPDSVTSIEAMAFSDCTKLTSVIFASQNNWLAGNDRIYDFMLDPAHAAAYLTGRYCSYNWTRDRS